MMKWINTTLFGLAVLASSTVMAVEVNINTADAETISQSLNGIGLKKAERIVEYRSQHGPFKDMESLTMVKGIGAKTVEKNKQDIQF